MVNRVSCSRRVNRLMVLPLPEEALGLLVFRAGEAFRVRVILPPGVGGQATGSDQSGIIHLIKRASNLKAEFGQLLRRVVPQPSD